MNKRIEAIKSLIGPHVRQLVEIRRKNNVFVPGVSMIPYAGRVYGHKEILNLIDSSLEFWLTAGRFVEEFEKRLARFVGVKFCASVNSGSSANLIAVSALTSPLLKKRQLKPGDEVITTACGFPTTLNPILQNNLVPVFVDVETGTYNIKVEEIEKAVGRRTKAIFVPHTLGNPADIGAILKIVKKYGLWFIEDNCDALGSSYRRQATGSFGHLSTLSFYPAHHLTTGEGGAVLTNDPLLHKIILSFRDWGRDCWCRSGQDNSCGKRFSRKFRDLPFGYDHKYVYSHIGYNLKMTDMQAAVGCAQLDKLSQFIRARRKNFEFLFKHLKKYDDYFIMPEVIEGAEPSWFGFPLLVKDSAFFQRNDIVMFLEDNKISTRMLFGGNLIRQPAYQDIKYRVFESLKNTDCVMNHLFWIGVYPGIRRKMLEYMVCVFDIFLNRKSKH